MAIKLPKNPDGEQYEDFVVAALQALGYFVEPQLKLREGKKEVLELDVVATPSGGGPQERVLYEAKKEEFSFSNAFKLFGQRTYLKIPKAVLVSLRGTTADYLPVYQSKGQELNVAMCHLPISLTGLDALAPVKNNLSEAQRGAVTAAAWFGQIGRRVALSELIRECGNRRGTPALDNARNYLFNVRSSFFQPDPLSRAEALYSAYLATPRMSGDAVALVASDRKYADSDVCEVVRDTYAYLWIQAIMDIEANARFTIIKTAFDDFIERGVAPPPTTTVKLSGLALQLPLHSLPASFYKGLEALRMRDCAARLPYLFQVFYSLLGGYFFFKDADERAFLSQLTCIPEDQLFDSVRLLNHFFAKEGKSFFFTAKDEMLCLKAVPAFVRGGGAFLRKLVFGLRDYSEKYPRMGWLVSRWHFALYSVLDPHLHT